MCLWSTPSAESEPSQGDRIMFVLCSPSHKNKARGCISMSSSIP